MASKNTHMIQLNITVNDYSEAARVASYLLSNKLVLSAKIFSRIKELRENNNKIDVQNKVLITALTKGLLFSLIEQKLREFAQPASFEIYALPIVNMDWQQAERLTADLEKV